MLEPPFAATRYASFFLFMLVLLLVFVTSFLAAYACFRRLCSSPRFLPLGMPVFLVYARTYARFCDLIFGCLCLFSSIMLAIWRDFDISSLLYLYCFRFARFKARTGSSTRVWVSWLVIPDTRCMVFDYSKQYSSIYHSIIHSFIIYSNIICSHFHSQ